MDEERAKLPLSLRDPMAILKKVGKPAIVLPFPTRPAVDAEAVEHTGDDVDRLLAERRALPEVRRRQAVAREVDEHVATPR